jgi:hypothetical protein
VVQRHVLYLGGISPSQAAAWCKSIEVFDGDAGYARTLALFPDDHATVAASDVSVVQLRLSEMRLCRPRQWGACWLGGHPLKIRESGKTASQSNPVPLVAYS